MTHEEAIPWAAGFIETLATRGDFSASREKMLEVADALSSPPARSASADDCEQLEIKLSAAEKTIEEMKSSPPSPGLVETAKLALEAIDAILSSLYGVERTGINANVPWNILLSGSRLEEKYRDVELLRSALAVAELVRERMEQRTRQKNTLCVSWAVSAAIGQNGEGEINAE